MAKALDKDLKIEQANDWFYKELREKVLSVSNPKLLGIYQMDEKSLTDTGYYILPLSTGQRLNDESNNDWNGQWTGKHGIRSKESFVNSEIKQGIAVREYHKLIWDNYLKDYQQYEGSVIDYVKLTKAGMIAASHLVGHDFLKDYIDTNGHISKEDSHDLAIHKYLRIFASYELDYSTNSLHTELLQEYTISLEVYSLLVKKYAQVTKNLLLFNATKQKIEGVFNKFVDIKLQEIDQNYDEIASIAQAKYYTTFMEYQEQLDAEHTSLATTAQKELDTVVAKKMESANATAYITHINGGMIVVDNKEEYLVKNAQLNQALNALHKELNDQLVEKQFEILAECKKSHELKRDDISNKISYVREEFDNFLSKVNNIIKSQADISQANPLSDPPLDYLSDIINQFTDNFTKTLGIAEDDHTTTN